MDLLRNVPTWDEVERTLDQKFNELNQSVNSGFQSANDSWNGFTRRASSAATTAYGYAGGNRIDSVRLAMAKSYPIIQTNLTRKWASIEIEKILPVLMQLIREVVMIVGGSVAIGTLAGGIAGSMAFGAGAAPGAIIGSGIGLQVGNLILMALGLAAIGEYFYNGLMPCLTTLYEGITTAWNAEEGLKHSGLDPTGGSAALKDERIERAARQMASGQEQLVLLLFTAIVTYLTRGQVKAGVLNSMESIATRSASLRAGMPNKELAEWLARNEQKMLANPELRVNEPAPLAKVEPEPTTLREHYARQDPDFVPLEKQKKFAKTFFPKGLSAKEINDYLMSPDGRLYLNKVKASAPNASAGEIFDRAVGHLASGSDVPSKLAIDTALVKIVPVGEKVTDYSPYFTTMEELQAAAKSQRTLADSLGLPLASENSKYTIFEISPLQPTDTFVSTVAPTVEFGGSIVRTGGARQYLIPNRSEWSAPKLIGTIDN